MFSATWILMEEPTCLHQGKVRNVYAWEDSLLLVATDRISAFDVILPSLIPGKGIALTQLSRFWFESLPSHIPHHVKSFSLPPGLSRPEWENRTTWCHRAEVIPMECVVRGYLAGSAWEEYRKQNSVQGHLLPSGLLESSKLPEPLFTPTTKAAQGHDQPLTESEAEAHVGKETYQQLKTLSLELYIWATGEALKRGLILADTKFEFGIIEGKICLVDECLTSDSSRYWPADTWAPGSTPHAFDKQFVRDYLKSLPDWNRQAPGPELPDEIIEKTRQRYIEAYTRLAGKSYIW
ncbi:MAG: phosphoribosylaminoimidazolesuccinocarboxamide synthase [Candidatus Methylacidiphilales bacterium]